MVPMELVGVRLELPANTPIVILRETEGRRRVVPIYIGGPEAAAIHYALEGIEPARPLTHDLLKNVLDELTTSLDRVVVTEVRDRTYYAELHLVNAAGSHTVSSRPSDAIALAVRTQTPDLRRGEPARRGRPGTGRGRAGRGRRRGRAARGLPRLHREREARGL